MLKEEWFNHDTNSNSLQNYQHFDADKDKEDLEGADEEYPSRHKREDMKETKLTHLKKGMKVQFIPHKGNGKQEGVVTHKYPDGSVDIRNNKDFIAKYKPQDVTMKLGMVESKLTKDDLIHKVLDGALLDPKSGQNKASVDGILHYIKKAGVKGITKGDIIKHAKTMAGLKIQGGNILKDIKEETMNEAKSTDWEVTYENQNVSGKKN